MEQKIEYGDDVEIVMRRTSVNGGLLRIALLGKLGYVAESDQAYAELSRDERVLNGLKLWFAKSMSQIVTQKGLPFQVPSHANGSTDSLFDQYLNLDETLVTLMWNTAIELDSPIGEKKTGNNSGDDSAVRATGSRRRNAAKTE